jgi:hypothetical protein
MFQSFNSSNVADPQPFNGSIVQQFKEESHGGNFHIGMVHPGIGDSMTASYFFVCRGCGAGVAQSSFITKIWQDAGAFRIRRGLPHTSSAGKTPLLQIKQKKLRVCSPQIVKSA